MAVSSTKLTIMAFPQRWDGASLKANILVLPHENPLAPFTENVPSGVNATPFAQAGFKLNAMVINSLDMMPKPSDISGVIPVAITPATDAFSLFQELKNSFQITKPSNVVNPVVPSTYIQKYLPQSYRTSFSFSQPRTPYAKIDDSYLCSMKEKDASLPKPVYSTNDVSWGKVFALALRQSLLARKLGFIYEVTIPVPVGSFSEGGWLYFDLNNESDYFEQMTLQPELIKKYAARIPSLSFARTLFAAVQFPVSETPVPGNYDPVFMEADDYDDGFAKIVHCMQPVSSNLLLEPGQENQGLQPTRDFGIRLCWDDEQLLIWQNRQMTADPDLGARLDAPMGIFNYRVDVKHHDEPDNEWNSLVKAKGDLVLNGINIGSFDGELGIEVGPTQLDGQKQGIYWLPSYYTQWTGSSLIIKDEKAAKLAATDAIVKKQLKAVEADKKPLIYGNSYDFRVRFADITGGSSGEKDIPVNGGEAPVATCRFRRFIPPQKVRIPQLLQQQEVIPPTSYKIYRPRLGYPSLLYTGLENAYNLLLTDYPDAIVEKREVGYADPDVTHVKIEVEVKAPEMDTFLSFNRKDSFYSLFTTIRPFPGNLTDPLELPVSFHDAAVIKFGDEADLGDLPLTTEASPLNLPTARNIRIKVYPLCKEDPTLAYFGNEETRTGKPILIDTRADSKDETNLFVDESPARQFQSILLQPDPLPSPNLAAMMTVSGQATETPSDLFQRLAEQLSLDSSDLSLFGKPGQRIVFGCSEKIRHTLSPENSSITFANKTDLVHQWITVLMVEINRDWAWDWLATISFEIRKNNSDLVGIVELKDTVSLTALVSADRTKTRIIFLDVVDPKDFPGEFPEPMDIGYTIKAIFLKEPENQDPDKSLSMTVPVAVAPAQVPKVVSAGIALSPFEHSEDYSATTNRKRVLWIEFSEPLHNPDDDYFAFVKAYAPDPILIPGQIPVADPKENIPFLPQERIRVITESSSDDRAGLNAWQRLIPCMEISPKHFMVPLPPGLHADSNELFGFFVYEFCVGHARVWSTAQGRFGRPLRLTGVQHPAPLLTCTASRTEEAVIATAPYAIPVYDGQKLVTNQPGTEMWGVLYTQVLQADGAAFRNILLGEKRMFRRREDFNTQQQNAIDMYGVCSWPQDEVLLLLQALGLPKDSPLSVLAIEMFKNYEPVTQPLSQDLGKMRIYRTSRLEPVPFMCCC